MLTTELKDIQEKQKKQPAASGPDHWDLVIKPQESAFDLQLKEVWRYRDLLAMFVKRDFVTFYKQTILGPLWFFIQPIFTTLIFTFVFGNVAKISTDGLPPVIFYLGGIVAWNYFSDCINTTSSVFTKNANIFGKVYFPRVIVPLSIIVSNLMRFGIQFGLLILIVAYYIIQGYFIEPNVYALLIPVLIILMAGLGLGSGMIISSLTTKYRDLTFLVTFGVQLLMYASPVIYPVSSLPEKYKWVVLANPMTSIIETFRLGLLGQGTFSIYHFGYTVVFSLAIVLLGAVIFNKVQRSFMDTV